jgi:hypothetical protein
MLRQFLHCHPLLRTVMVCLFLLGLTGNLAATPAGMSGSHGMVHHGAGHGGVAQAPFDGADNGSHRGSADEDFAMEDNSIDDSLVLPMLPTLHLAMVPHAPVAHGAASLDDNPIPSELRPPIG